MAAYAYFDQNGNLLEFISDKSLRQGNENAGNQILVFMEPEEFNYAGKSLRCTYKDKNLNLITEDVINILQNIETKTMPTFKDYDPTHFVSGKSYPFIKVIVPNEVLETEGSKFLSLAITEIDDEEQETVYLNYKSIITFYVEESVIQFTQMISKSQFDYLLAKIGEIDDKVISLSHIIYKANSVSDLGSLSQYEVGQCFLIINDNDVYKPTLFIYLGSDSLTPIFSFLDHYTKSETDTMLTNLLNIVDTKSTVSGTVDDNNKWATITIDGETHEIGGSGGGEGHDYSAGNGINISQQDVISVDETVVATKSFIESNYEKLSNKVTSISGSSTDAQYPTAKCVYDNLENVREVAEGKCNTFVLSYATTAPTTDGQAALLKKSNGTNFTDLSDFNSYVGEKSLLNSQFNSQNNAISVGYSTFYIITIDQIVYLGTEIVNSFKTGDIFLIVQTNVPDRWLANTGTGYLDFNKLETSKVDLTQYYTKIQTDTLLGDKADKVGVLPHFNVLFEDLVLDFITNNVVTEKPIIIKMHNYSYIGQFHYIGTGYLFEFENLENGDRYTSNGTNLSGVTFQDLFSNTYLNNYEEAKNKTTSLSSSSTNTQYPSAKAVYDADQNVRHIIAPEYDATSTYAVGDKVIYDGKLYTCSVAIDIAEEWNPLHWTATRVNSSFVDLDSAQTIAGVKTFLKALQLGDANYSVRKDGSVIRIKVNGSDVFVFGSSSSASGVNIRPLNDNNVDLGVSSQKWRDLYLGGKIKDGTNEVSVADISNGLFNVINVSDIVGALTQAQYDLITNGKPTIIIGNYGGFVNPILRPNGAASYNVVYGLIEGQDSTNGRVFYRKKYFINTQNRSLTIGTEWDSFNEYNDTFTYRGKTVPAYKSDTTKQYKFVQKVGGNLDYVEDKATILYKHLVSIASGTYDLVIIDNDSTPITKANIGSRLQTCVSRKWDINSDGTELVDLIVALESGSDIKIVWYNFSVSSIQTSTITDNLLNTLTDTVTQY